MANRSEVMKKAWRKRKREGGKAKCAFCGKPIFARGVRMKGKPYHKGCAEAKGAGLKPAQVGKNLFEGDRMQMTAKRKRAEAAAKKLQMTKFPNRPQYEIAEDIMNGLLTFSGKPTALGKKVGAYKNPGTNWHVDRASELRERVRGYTRIGKIAPMSLYGAIEESDYAAEASRRRGMNPSKEWHLNRAKDLLYKLQETRKGTKTYNELKARLKEEMYAGKIGPFELGVQSVDNPSKYKWAPIWGKSGILLYKKDMSDKNSIGIGREHLSAVIRYLERGTGFLGLANRLDLTRTSMGITLKDYQGRRLYIPNREIPEALDVLHNAMLTKANPRRKISERKRAPRDAFRYFGAEELNPLTKKESAKLAAEMRKDILASKRAKGDYTKGLFEGMAAGKSKVVSEYGTLTSAQLDKIWRNPKFKFGPTGFRPPAKWFSKMAQGTSASYFGRKLKALTASQRAKVGQIVGGIWAKYTDATRFEILRKYEPSAVRALANPSLGKKVQMLNCPACGNPTPVSRINVYLRCNVCGAHLRTVKVVRKK